MEEKLIFGKPIADRINEDTAGFIANCELAGKRIPKIAVVLANDSFASKAYITGFEKLCAKVKMNYEIVEVANESSECELLKVIEQLNQDELVDGILLQMPLPAHINPQVIVEAIDPLKDIDGMHPMNAGKVVMNQEGFIPCTAESAMEFIHECQFDLKGKEVVVLGRSNVIGKPVAQLCLKEHATVTICHSRTENIEQVCQRGDVVISAIGQAKLVNSNWIKEGAVVIDVGMNRDADGKLCGDVDLDDVICKVARISPVPKGVGVVTNAILLSHAITAYQRKEK